MRQESTSESVSRLGRFAKSQTDEKKQPDPVKRLQEFAKAEAERKKKKDAEEAEARRKKGQVQTAPEKGFLQRMYERYVGGGEKK